MSKVNIAGVSHRDEHELASLGSLRGIKLQLAKSRDGKKDLNDKNLKTLIRTLQLCLQNLILTDSDGYNWLQSHNQGSKTAFVLNWEHVIKRQRAKARLLPSRTPVLDPSIKPAVSPEMSKCYSELPGATWIYTTFRIIQNINTTQVPPWHHSSPAPGEGNPVETESRKSFSTQWFITMMFSYLGRPHACSCLCHRLSNPWGNPCLMLLASGSQCHRPKTATEDLSHSSLIPHCPWPRSGQETDVTVSLTYFCPVCPMSPLLRGVLFSHRPL